MSIRYSSQLSTILVASGTLFNQVLLWLPLHSAETRARLIGHEGVIYHTKFSESLTHVSSASDDRSARVWNIQQLLDSWEQSIPNEPTVSESVEVEPIAVLWGHDARLWQSHIITREGYDPSLS